MSRQTKRGTHIEIKWHCKKRLICCQLAIFVLWVKSLNISPHGTQPVPEIISELLNGNGNTLPDCLHKSTATPQLLKHLRSQSSRRGLVNVCSDPLSTPCLTSHCSTWACDYSIWQQTWTGKTLVSTLPQDRPICGGTLNTRLALQNTHEIESYGSSIMEPSAPAAAVCDLAL